MRRIPTSDVDSDPAVQRLIAETRARERQDMTRRELEVEVPLAIAFLAAAVVLPLALAGGRSFDPAIAIALVGVYALAWRSDFQVGAGWAVPSQLVLVPMLFLLPPTIVPLLVGMGLMVAGLPDYANPRRTIVDLGNAWHAVGPALVLAATGPSDPTWSDWPIYLAAFGAGVAFDIGRALIHGLLAIRVTPRALVAELTSAYFADALLAPVGLLIAMSSVTEGTWSFLVIVPMLAMIRLFGREREARVENAMALGNAYRGTAHLLGDLLSASHEYTAAHSRSVVLLGHRVGLELGVDESTLREIEFGALLHDVGKISVPNEILNKPGKLNAAEWECMRQHTIEGQSMLDQIGGVLGDVGVVVRSHHERWDGNGYPDGISGEDIPMPARVISACDAFNAMVTDRPYRSAMTTEEAVAELRANAGSQFDPSVVEVLARIVEEPLRAGVPALGDRRRFQPPAEARTTAHV